MNEFEARLRRSLAEKTATEAKERENAQRQAAEEEECVKRALDVINAENDAISNQQRATFSSYLSRSQLARLLEVARSAVRGELKQDNVEEELDPVRPASVTPQLFAKAKWRVDKRSGFRKTTFTLVWDKVGDSFHYVKVTLVNNGLVEVLGKDNIKFDYSDWSAKPALIENGLLQAILEPGYYIGRTTREHDPNEDLWKGRHLK